MSDNETTRYFDVKLLILCAFVAALYLVGLVSRSVWYDEAITLQSLAAQRFVYPEPGFISIGDLKLHIEGPTSLSYVFRHYIEVDIHPPLYYLLAYFASTIFGNDLYVVRGVSFVLVISSVYFFGRGLERSGERLYLIGAGIYALSFVVLTSAQDARAYALILFLLIIAWRLLAENPLPERNSGDTVRISPEILLGVVCAALMLTHYFSVFVVAPVFAWRAIESLRVRKIHGFVAPVVCALIFAPWLPIMLEHLGARPDQNVGFPGFLAWAKHTAQLVPAQIFSATHWAVPSQIQLVGRVFMLALMLIGGISFLLGRSAYQEHTRLGWVAIGIPTVGILMFLTALIVMDRRFFALRYYTFFAPFFAYFVFIGTTTLGRFVAHFTGGRNVVKAIPGLVVVVALLSMANFGWESNLNRGGGGETYNSMARSIEEAGPERTLIILDLTRRERGKLLSLIQAFPPEAEIYVLPYDDAAWSQAVPDVTRAVSEADTVLLIYTVYRGTMGEDKSYLYPSFVEIFEENDFKRAAALPQPFGPHQYAKWRRPET